MTKICFKCKKEKPLTEFYKHPQMSDGHVNKCKECNKKDVKENYLANCENPEYVQKERERGRDKYHRLNYAERIHYRKNYQTVECRNINRKIRNKGVVMFEKEAHHWNYKLPNDVFILSRKAHKLIHKEIKYVEDENCFITKNNEKLDTKEKHFSFIKSVFSKNNVNYEIDSLQF